MDSLESEEKRMAVWQGRVSLRGSTFFVRNAHTVAKFVKGKLDNEPNQIKLPYHVHTVAFRVIGHIPVVYYGINHTHRFETKEKLNRITTNEEQIGSFCFTDA